MTLTAIKTVTAVLAATETNIHTALADESLKISIVNESGGAGTITGLSASTATATQNTAGNLLPTGFPIADKQVITITGVVMTTVLEFLVLNASVAVQTTVEGWKDV